MNATKVRRLAAFYCVRQDILAELIGDVPETPVPSDVNHALTREQLRSEWERFTSDGGHRPPDVPDTPQSPAPQPPT